MLIAIPREGTMIGQHFGRSKEFAIFDTVSRSWQTLTRTGNECAGLPSLLKGAGVDVVIAGGMGASAKNLVQAQGIKVISGAQGTLEDAVQAFEKGQLQDSGVVCSEHQHEGHCHH